MLWSFFFPFLLSMSLQLLQWQMWSLERGIYTAEQRDHSVFCLPSHHVQLFFTFPFSKKKKKRRNRKNPFINNWGSARAERVLKGGWNNHRRRLQMKTSCGSTGAHLICALEMRWELKHGALAATACGAAAVFSCQMHLTVKSCCTVMCCSTETEAASSHVDTEPL